MKAVRGIKHARAFLPAGAGREAGQHAAHRRVAVNQRVALGIHQRFQLPVGRAVARVQRGTLKGDFDVAIAKRHGGVRLAGIVAGGAVNLVPLRLEPLHIRQMENQNMPAQHRGHKQHFPGHRQPSAARTVASNVGWASSRKA